MDMEFLIKMAEPVLKASIMGKELCEEKKTQMKQETADLSSIDLYKTNYTRRGQSNSISLTFLKHIF
jgi:hypothetical protein